jgi:RNA polymerase sporulation-specific sigma factor
LSDDELIELINQKDKKALDFLMNKYKEDVNIKTSKYYIHGAEQDDLAQEGLIGLFKAIKNYDQSKGISFKSFANLCIERQILTAIKGSNRQKHLPLNSYVSLNSSTYENEDGEVDNILIDKLDTHVIEDPLDTITKKEYFSYVNKTIEDTLSDYEKKVLSKFIIGESYAQIAESLDSPIKSVDNAIQRIRKKTINKIEKNN